MDNEEDSEMKTEEDLEVEATVMEANRWHIALRVYYNNKVEIHIYFIEERIQLKSKLY